MNRSNFTVSSRHLWAALFLAVTIAYFCDLGMPPLLGRDEPRYAQVAREMFERGDMVTPTLGGQTWFEKPALLYWLMMASYAVFGVSEWAARFGSACSGLLCVALLGWLAARVEDAAGASSRWFGLAAAGALATSGGLIAFARGATFDILVTMTLTLALACFFVSEITSEERRRWPLAGFWTGVGLSLLAKGLIGVVLPLGIIGLYFVLRRHWPDTRRLGVVWGLPLALIVAATWYAPVIARHGWPFVDEFFVQHHFARFTSDKYRHAQQFYYYGPILVLLALPWTPFLVASLFGARRWQWRADDPMSKLRLFALCWLIVPVAFFSLSGSKLSGYILPALPAVALLVGDRLARVLRGEDKGHTMRATGALFLALAGGSVVYAALNRDVALVIACMVAAPLAVAGALAVLTKTQSLNRLRVAALVGAMLLAVPLLVDGVLGQAANRRSVRALVWQATARGYGAAPVFGLDTVERTAEFYAAGRVAYGQDGEPIKLQNPQEVEDAARRSGDKVLVFVPLKHVAELTTNAALKTDVIGDNGKIALVGVRPLPSVNHS